MVKKPKTRKNSAKFSLDKELKTSHADRSLNDDFVSQLLILSLQIDGCFPRLCFPHRLRSSIFSEFVHKQPGSDSAVFAALQSDLQTTLDLLSFLACLQQPGSKFGNF